MNLRDLRILIGVSAYIFSIASATANSLDMNFSDQSVRARFSQDVQGSAQGRKDMGMSLLYNTDENVMFDAWFQITDETGSKAPGLDAGVGFKAYVGKTASQDYVAVAIGGDLLFRPVQSNRLLFQAGGFVAPRIVTFLDADNLWEINLRIGYEVLPTAIAYVGFRMIRVNFNMTEDEQVVDRGGHVGLELRF